MSIIQKILLFLAALFLFSIPAHAGTFTAASCAMGDVNAVINGPTHVAADGDIIVIPGTACTWTGSSGISISSGIGLTIEGTGTPNSSPSQFGVSVSCQATQLTDSLTSGAIMFHFHPTATSSTTRVSCIDFIPTKPGTGYNWPIAVSGTCNSTTCPSIRLDNLTVPAIWGGSGTNTDAFSAVSNVWGVADHNNIGDSSGIFGSNGVQLFNDGDPQWLGVGNNGDNSWATADTFGTNEELYLENNIIENAFGTDNGPAGGGGGGRWVCRVNKFIGITPADGCTNHGTDTGGRMRGNRQLESYANYVDCATVSCKNGVAGSRSGAGIVWGNSITAGNMAHLFSSVTERRWRGNNPFNECNGNSVWDTNDGGATPTIYFGPSTIGSVSLASGNYTVTDSGSPGWTVNQWASSGGQPYSFVDITQGFGFELASNTASSITSFFSCNNGGNGCTEAPAVNDVYEIRRATVCMDQWNRGQGSLVANDITLNFSSFSESGTTVTATLTAASVAPAVGARIAPSGTSNSGYNGHQYIISAVIGSSPYTQFQFIAASGLGSATGGSTIFTVLQSTGSAGPVNEALDPVYEADDIGSITGNPVVSGDSQSQIQGRDFYSEYTGQTAQTSATSPFNGTTTCAGSHACGTGYGTLANRPTTCTTGVGYWATDQGTWNTSGLTMADGNKQGQLYVCTSTNTWSLYYTPFTYPHPLTQTTAVTITPSSNNFGTVNTGQSSSPQTFIITNNNAVTVTSITPSLGGTNPGDFSDANSGAGSCSAAGGTLTTGQTCSITATFTPTTTGSRSATLSVSYSGGDGNSPVTASLSGTGQTTGTPVFALTPASTNFLSQPTNIASASQPLTLTNTGNGSGTISTIVFSSTNASDFSQTNTCGTLPATLAANASCTINVVFTPGATGARGPATITVTDTPDSINATATVQGVGTSCANTNIPNQDGSASSFYFCGAVYNDVNTGTVSATYAPTPGNGVGIHITWGSSSGFTVPPTERLLSVGDNINNPEPCFIPSPHLNGVILDSNPNGGHDYQIYFELYCPRIPSGVTTFTANTTGTPHSFQILPYELEGVTQTNFWENNDNTNTSTSSGLSATVTETGPTTASQDLILGFLNNSGADTNGIVGSGYTCMLCNPGPTPGVVAEAMAVKVTGTYTANMTWLTNNRNFFALTGALIGSANSVGTPLPFGILW